MFGCVTFRIRRHILDLEEAEKPPMLVEISERSRLVPDILPVGFPDEGVVCVGLKTIPREEWSTLELHNGDSIVAIDGPGPGVVFSLIVGAVVSVTGVSVATATGIVAGTLLSIAASGISFAVQALLGPGSQSSSTRKSREDDSIGIFQGQQNTIGPGRPIPIIVGRIRSFPHIIETFPSPKYQYLETERGTIIGTSTPLDDEEGVALNTRVAYAIGPLQDITLHEIDDNPLSNMAGGVIHDDQIGDPDQPPMEGFSENKTSRDIQSDLTVTGGVVQQTTTTPVDGFEVSVMFLNGLFLVTSNVVRQTSVQIRIRYRTTAGPGSWTTLVSHTVEGSSTAPFQIWIKSGLLSREQYDIELLRITADGPPAGGQDASRWENLVENISGRRSYPGLAMTGFSQIPQTAGFGAVPRKYSAVVRGYKRFRAYTDATTYTRFYTANAAWVGAGLLTSPSFSEPKYSYDDFDIDELILLANHCAELVPDGAGGTEPRFEWNAEIASRLSLGQVIQQWRTITQSFIADVGGKIRIKVGQHESRVCVLGEGQYRRGSVKYVPIEQPDRVNRISCRYKNAAKDWRVDSVSLQIAEGVRATGHFEDEIELPGATSEGQVTRTLRRILRQNRYATAQIELTAGLEALCIGFASRFGVAMVNRAQDVASGIVEWISGDGVTISLGQKITMETGKTYEITISHQGTEAATSTAAKAISQVALTHRFPDQETDAVQVTVRADLAALIQVGDGWSISETGYGVEDFRALDVRLNSDLSVTIIAETYNELVYDDVDNIDDLVVSDDETDISQTDFLPDLIPGPVTDVTVTQESGDLVVYWRPGGAANPVIPSQLISSGASYEVYIREPGGTTWRLVGWSRSKHIRTQFDAAGAYPAALWEVKVVAVSETGRKQGLDIAPSSGTFTLV